MFSQLNFTKHAPLWSPVKTCGSLRGRHNGDYQTIRLAKLRLLWECSLSPRCFFLDPRLPSSGGTQGFASPLPPEDSTYLFLF
ncbi:MAG: hypothetical protein ACMUJM_00695 [bacterium]